MVKGNCLVCSNASLLTDNSITSWSWCCYICGIMANSQYIMYTYLFLIYNYMQYTRIETEHY